MATSNPPDRQTAKGCWQRGEESIRKADSSVHNGNLNASSGLLCQRGHLQAAALHHCTETGGSTVQERRVPPIELPSWDSHLSRACMSDSMNNSPGSCRTRCQRWLHGSLLAKWTSGKDGEPLHDASLRATTQPKYCPLHRLSSQDRPLPTPYVNASRWHSRDRKILYEPCNH